MSKLFGLARCSLLVATGLVLFIRNAEANGRFPAASQLVVDPHDPNHLLVRTTFGLLRSNDRGKKWSWICDMVVGFGDYEDPAIGIGQNGSLFATLFMRGGIAASFDQGCTWAKDAMQGLPVPDLAVDPSDATKATAVVAGSTADDAGKLSYHSYLVETRDAGKGWTRLGQPLPDGILATTVQMAPSKPTRIYVSGTNILEHRQGVILRTDDGGETWVTMMRSEETWSSPWISAVDPSNPDRVFVRLDADPNDRLVVTNDAGAAWTEIFVGAGPLLGFALSPDGKRVAVGGPMDGIQVAAVSEYVFTKTSSILTQCLTWTSDGLFACGRVPDPFLIGLSKDEGRTFRTLNDLEEFCPADCRNDAFVQKCPERWNRIQADLVGRPGFACPNLPPDWDVRPDPPKDPSLDAGGSGGGRADAAADVGGDSKGTGPAANSGGCSSCGFARHTVRGSPMTVPMLTLASLAGATVRRRARRRAVRGLPAGDRCSERDLG